MAASHEQRRHYSANQWQPNTRKVDIIIILNQSLKSSHKQGGRYSANQLQPHTSKIDIEVHVCSISKQSHTSNQH